MKTFKQKVFDVVRKIPKGEILTYKEVARRAGSRPEHVEGSDQFLKQILIQKFLAIGLFVVTIS